MLILSTMRRHHEVWRCEQDELAGLEDEWAADDAYADGAADATPSYLLPEAGTGEVADAEAAGADEYGLPVAPAAAT